MWPCLQNGSSCLAGGEQTCQCSGVPRGCVSAGLLEFTGRGRHPAALCAPGFRPTPLPWWCCVSLCVSPSSECLRRLLSAPQLSPPTHPHTPRTAVTRGVLEPASLSVSCWIFREFCRPAADMTCQRGIRRGGGGECSQLQRCTPDLSVKTSPRLHCGRVPWCCYAGWAFVLWFAFSEHFTGL